MIRLHHSHGTRSMRVLWMLEEIGADYGLEVRPLDATLRLPEYLDLHPAARVPVLELDGAVYWESGAILQILAEKYPEAGLGREPGAPDRPDFLVWLHFSETVTQHVAALTQQHIFLSEDRFRSPRLMRIEALRIAKCFTAIEKRLTGSVLRPDTLLPSGFSAADIAVGQAVWMARHFHGLDDFPQTAAWMARLEAREAFGKAAPPEGAAQLFAQDFYPPWPESD